MKERLQKIIARAGICSRRKAEELIRAGKVRLNGQKVTELGTSADPVIDSITVQGKKLSFPPSVYILLYKPRNVITSLHDPQGRPTIKDFIKRLPHRTFPVGRLDFDAEGLILLTNDGELANRIQHPAHKVEKTYLVKVKGLVMPDKLAILKNGINSEDLKTQPAKIELVRTADKNTWLRLILTEGQKHQVKLMCDYIGHPCLKLIRIGIAFLGTQNLKPGSHRPLEKSEINRLLKKVGLANNRHK